ncbi:hypothetical protein LEP1GSC124_3904 [Leptospira interrogans serovar Pyrogenes str. 200701872]|uniref:Uncharacterized protein n=1 Tax=Leptospira interrogans serovar Pyrogenes str. 200701872 TaxID=1193029 RepID=M6ZJM8_LEPIR|nr:hypothetical protein LEP1GSC124_3904 [Leptospira interrogans serovar Pyrogenes str. 200701872]
MLSSLGGKSYILGFWDKLKMNFLKTNEERKFHLKDSISRILIFKFNKKLNILKL